jgi:hypothetical protein
MAKPRAAKKAKAKPVQSQLPGVPPSLPAGTTTPIRSSRLVARGVSSYIVQQAGGWRTASMMARYAHLDPATIRAAVELLALRDKTASASGTDSGIEDPERCRLACNYPFGMWCAWQESNLRPSD